nr:type IVB secretion system protein IcmH/DotU [uncultured Moellerella sp.]
MTYLFDDIKTVRVERYSEPQQVNESYFPLVHSVAKEKHYKALPIRNKLIAMATPLIITLLYLAKRNVPKDVSQFRGDIVKKINRFIELGKKSYYHNSTVEKTAFIFCAYFDEFILNTPWGKNSGWENYSLLSLLFNNRKGGEYFFNFLEHAYRKTDLLKDFLELQYYLISLGFKGKYLYDKDRLNNIHHSIYLKLNDRPVVEIKNKSGNPIVKNKKSIVKEIFNYSKICSLLFITIIVIWGVSEYSYNYLSYDVIKSISNNKSHIINNG